MLRSFGKSMVVALVCAASGCSSSCCYDFVDESLTGCHDHLEAKMAWHANSDCFCEVEYIRDFKEGFIAGYIHVMNGGGCCRPTLPPRKYWSICTRGPENNCRVVAWYNGWSAGVAQAHRDGMGSNPILTGPDIYHTNCQIPVALPDDLMRDAAVEHYEEHDTIRQMPADQGIFPADQGGEGGSQVPLNPVPVQPDYNPPAVPEQNAPPAAAIPPSWRKSIVDVSLVPPAPPRGEDGE